MALLEYFVLQMLYIDIRFPPPPFEVFGPPPPFEVFGKFVYPRCTMFQINIVLPQYLKKNLLGLSVGPLPPPPLYSIFLV